MIDLGVFGLVVVAVIAGGIVRKQFFDTPPKPFSVPCEPAAGDLRTNWVRAACDGCGEVPNVIYDSGHCWHCVHGESK